MAIKETKVVVKDKDLDSLSQSIKTRVIDKIASAYGKESKSLNKDIRKVFQNLSINYLNNYEKVEKLFNEATTKLINNDKNLNTLLLEVQDPKRPRKDIDKDIKELLNKYFPEGIKVKGRKIETAAGLLTLQQVVRQERGGNFDQFTAIRTIIGEGKDTQKGHSNASIILLQIEAALKTPEIARDIGVVRDLEKLRVAARLIDRVEEEELQNAFAKAGIPKSARARKIDFLKIIDELLSGVPEIGIDLFVTRDVFASLANGSVDVKLLIDIQEDQVFNERKGSLSQILGQSFNALLKDKKISDKVGQELISKIDVAAISSSWNMYKLINNVIVNAILGKGYRYKNKGKPVNKKEKLKIPTTKYARKKLKKVPKKGLVYKNKNRYKDVKVDDIDLFSTQNLINQILAMNVEEQMADSGSTDGRLRYQTGRFADSAKLLTLTRAQAGVLAGTYTYMRNPYDVFLPGHKMATPKRDPRIYVEGAIREAAITVLKNRFPGINVELV